MQDFEDELKPGTVFAEQFEIGKPIGSGGMGIVYEARQQGLDRLVALKILHTTAVADLARFEREVRMLSQVQHDGIVKIYSVGGSEGRPFFAMELLEGQSLANRLKSGKISPAETVSIAQQVIDALSYLHSRGIIHRDVKPQNIFMCGETVKLLDFGLARFSKDETHLALTSSGSGVVAGTPLYMSPEQCRGENALLGSDYYSLGCTMFECLTGSPPFTGEGASVLIQHLKDDRKQARRRLDGAGVPPGLRDIILRMIKVDPGERLATTGELGVALSSAPTRSLRVFKLNPLQVVGVVLLAVGMFACGYWFNSRQTVSMESVIQTSKPRARDAGDFSHELERLVNTKRYRDALSMYENEERLVQNWKPVHRANVYRCLSVAYAVGEPKNFDRACNLADLSYEEITKVGPNTGERAWGKMCQWHAECFLLASKNFRKKNELPSALVALAKANKTAGHLEGREYDELRKRVASDLKEVTEEMNGARSLESR